MFNQVYFNPAFSGTNEHPRFTTGYRNQWPGLGNTYVSYYATFDQHVALDQADAKYILVTNVVPYQYYAFKIANNYGSVSFLAVRRIELQTEDGFGVGGPSGYAFLM